MATIRPLDERSLMTRRLPVATLAAASTLALTAYLAVSVVVGRLRPWTVAALVLATTLLAGAAVQRVRARQRRLEDAAVVDELALARRRRVARSTTWDQPTQVLPEWTQPVDARIADAVGRAADPLRLQLLADLEESTGELRRRLWGGAA